ncbi:S8 family serine peptidase [Pseudokineococcus sp. 1T1Z-3]|uniref:S8 family serine peptidase n=1 Tax=Pseudokineococcus sp. 1T1Z-3 TaxID=3132745 RepID=UPI0030B367A0
MATAVASTLLLGGAAALPAAASTPGPPPATAPDGQVPETLTRESLPLPDGSTATDAASALEDLPAGELLRLDDDLDLTPSADLVEQFEEGRHVVVLAAPPVAEALGEDGTGPAAAQDEQALEQALVQAQDDVADEIGATPVDNLTLVTNGFVADLTPEQAARASLDPRVLEVVPDEILPLATTGTEFLGLEGPDGVWADLGGPEGLGDGVVVGIIDTGIAPENPSFAGEPLASIPQDGEPYRDGDEVVFTKSDGGTFRGTCQEGAGFTAEDCSTKVVGARYFVEGFGDIGGESVGEYRSPRDGSGHGSHVAGTAAGNPGVDADGTAISGVTPGARIAAYKVCWTGPLDWASFDDGCALSDLVAAIEAATADGVDVINYSIGGGAAESTATLVDRAFLAAASSGVFVAAAAGNSGPTASTLDNASPWITTVAASTLPPPLGTVDLGDQSLLGASTTVPEGGVTGPLRLAENLAREDADVASARLCLPGSLDPAETAGAVVVCERGIVARTEKSAEVAAAGGAGTVLVNPFPDSVDADAHTLPTVHLDVDAAPALREHAQAQDPTVTLLPGNPQGLPALPAPEIAGFSSRGPVVADGSDLLKPDVAAPGTTVLAATSNAPGGEPGFEYLSGTSMASPHVAGLGAMYLSQDPQASPAEIKSALMTTGSDLVRRDGSAPDVFAQGAGQVVPGSFLDPGLLYLSGTEDWLDYLGALGLAGGREELDPSDLNLASLAIGSLAGEQTVTRTLTATRAGSWSAVVEGMEGVDVTVEPAQLTFTEAGQEQEVSLTFRPVDAPTGTFTTGFLTWTGEGEQQVRSPMAVQPVDFAAPTIVHADGASGSATFETSFGVAAEHEISTAGLTRGARAYGQGESSGSSHLYGVTVPEGADLLVVDAAAISGDADLAVQLLWRFDDGRVLSVGQAQQADGREVIVLEDPWESSFVVEVYFPGGPPEATVDYELATYVVDADAPDQPFDVEPGSVRGGPGDRSEVTASWADLPGGSFLGAMTYGSTGTTTLLAVDAGATEATPGEPTLTVDPGEGEWLLASGLVRATATGLRPGGTYRLTLDDGTLARSGPATEDGVVDWLYETSPSTELGVRTLQLSGEGVELTGTFRVTSGYVVGGTGSSEVAFDGSSWASYSILRAGRGDVRLQVTHAGTGEVVYDALAEPLTATQLTTGLFPAPPGELRAVATVVMPGGGGPTFEYPPLQVTGGTPSTVEVGAPDEAGDVTVTVTNVRDLPEVLTVIYAGCDGTRVVGYDNVAPGVSTRTWNLAGYVSATVYDSEGRLFTEHLVTHETRCAERAAEPTGHDLWLTFVDPAVSAEPSAPTTPEAPVAGSLSYRYEPGISTFNLIAGQGERMGDGPLLFPDPDGSTQVTVEPTEERGPVWTTEFAVVEGLPIWLDLNFAVLEPEFIYGWFRMDLPAVTLADLQPQEPVAPELAVSVRERRADLGGSLTVDVEGLAPGRTVEVRLQRVAGRDAPMVLGTLTGGAGGRASAVLDVPAQARAGAHVVHVDEATSAIVALRAPRGWPR